MKIVFTSFLLTLAFSAQVTGQEHSHDHAPGHCPACESFSAENAKRPTKFEGKVKDWNGPSMSEPTTPYAFGLIGLGAAVAIAALVTRRFKRP